jgi:galactokinase
VPTAEVRADLAFRRLFRGAPEGVWTAPGRVNLIGEHTDYNDGFALPFALAQTTAVAIRSVPGRAARIWSETYDSLVTIRARKPREGEVRWYDYVAGVQWALAEAGFTVPGVEIAVASDVPTGAGLSSSAALECAVLTALCDLHALDLPLSDRPALAQRAENGYVGVPCGILDQTASLLCRTGCALHIDFRTMATRQVSMPATILVTNTHAAHRHADGAYARRRASCHAAADILGLRALRDATVAELAGIRDPLIRKRARHVVTENQRVNDTVTALDASNLTTVGRLLTASHLSMRDDFEITVPEVDLAVSAALDAGALGARMTGGGFGGCVVALIGPDDVDTVAAAVRAAFRTAGYRAPTTFVSVPGAGARRAPAPGGPASTSSTRYNS